MHGGEYKCEAVTVGLNVRYLMDVLNASQAGYITQRGDTTMDHLDFPEPLEEDTSWREEYETAYTGSDSEATVLDSHQSLTDERRADLEQCWEHRILREIEAEMGRGEASDQDRYKALVDGLRRLVIRAVQERFPAAQVLAIEQGFIDPLTEATARQHPSLSQDRSLTCGPTLPPTNPRWGRRHLD
jgi:hypothetical protein